MVISDLYAAIPFFPPVHYRERMVSIFKQNDAGASLDSITAAFLTRKCTQCEAVGVLLTALCCLSNTVI